MDERLRSQIFRSLGDAPGISSRSRAATNSVRPASNLHTSSQLLLQRTFRYATTELPDSRIDRDALELACLAMMLPFAASESPKQSSMGVFSIADRCAQASELLAGMTATDATDDLVDRATRILSECPRRATTLAEARALSDAINLEDFGIAGICRSVAMLLRPGGPLAQLTDAFNKREQYGYWEARLKDSFHFESTRHRAKERLQAARACMKQLVSELEEDVG